MAAASRLIIPIQAEYLSLEGLANLIDTYKRVRETINPKLSILGIIITKYLANCRLSREVSHDLRRSMGSLVFDNVIPQNIRLAEAPGHAEPIIVYDRQSAGAASYLAVTEEIISRLNLK
jgi:chromosome partitioning protein